VTVGTVDFTVDGVAIASGVALDAGGFAGFSTSALTVGTRVVEATYVGTPEFASSAASLDQVVDDAAVEPEPEPEPEPDPDGQPGPGPDGTVPPTSAPTSPPGTARALPAVTSPSASTPGGAALPATGSPVATVVLIAGALIAAGALALVTTARRRRDALAGAASGTHPDLL
jgi:hypothetical protein